MSQFDDLFAASALPLLFEHFGAGEAATVIYRAKSGRETPGLAAILGKITADEEETGMGRSKRWRRLVKLTTDPASSFGGLADAHLDGELKIAGAWWTIESVDGQTPAFVQLTVSRLGTLEASRPNLRRQP